MKYKLIIICSIVGVVLSGVLADSSPGFGPENLLGLVLGAAIGWTLQRALAPASKGL